MSHDLKFCSFGLWAHEDNKARLLPIRRLTVAGFARVSRGLRVASIVKT